MNQQQQFRSTAASGLAVACVLLGAPFALSHVFSGEWLVGAGGLASSGLLCAHAALMRRNSPAAQFTLAVMAPLGIWFLVYLVYSFGFIGLLWCFPGILGLYCLLSEREAWFANLTLYALVMIVGQQVLTPDLLLRAAATLLAVNLFAALLLRAVTAQFQSLERRIATDPLTGLLNRYELERSLEARLMSRRRVDAASALLALDLDHFKRVNDELGHAAGDELLRKLGHCLNASIRAGDEAFRIGGEEFLVVLGNLDEHDALERAEAIRKAVSTGLSSPERAVSVSIGVAAALPEDTWSHWMSRADSALYRAKAEGRNRVCIAVVHSERDPGAVTTTRQTSIVTTGAIA